MRGLLLGLLLVNILYAGFEFALAAGVVGGIHLPAVEESISEVVLLADADAGQLLEYPQGSSTFVAGDLLADSGPSTGFQPRPYCAQVGQFRSLDDANDFIAVNASKMRAELDVRRLEARRQYRVYIPPFEDRGAATDAIAQLRTILAANDLVIDSFLIPQGELANGIALGLFFEQANAVNVKLQLENIGYDVLIQEVQSSRQEWNVSIGELESEAVFQGYWAEIHLKRPYLQAAEKLCETIAEGI